MSPIPFSTANKVFTAPSLNSNIVDLHVFDSGESLTSLWELTDDDLMNLAKNRCIKLTIYGKGHPPVSLSTIDPLEYETTDTTQDPDTGTDGGKEPPANNVPGES